MNNDRLKTLERKLNKFAVRNLMTILIFCMGVVFFASIILYAANNALNLQGLMAFDRGAILSGQVWRIITFLLLPPQSSVMFMLFSLYFYWLLGSTLEREWGTLKFNLFYLCGALCLIVAGFITGYADNHYLNMSLFFAFAILYPEHEMLLFFVIPIKMKYLAIIDALYFLYMFIVGGWYIRASILACAVNLAIFFSGDVIAYFKRKKRQAEWRRNFR